MTDVGVKDPLWRDIQRELGRRLDPLLFERCAADLLQAAYPGLAPVSGPGDGGMDGAIGTDDGPPTVLVCTTSPDVIGNLRKSLESYKATGGPNRGVVVATSQALTPRKRRNLERRAHEFGFLLKNVHDQDDFVGRLYRNPFWRRELLGLVGKLPALSVYPRRPGWEDHELLGRDKELDWMRNQTEDYVLVGQPGVGKTALLRALARRGRGLFTATNDLHRIADAYRESQPEFVFLPDAHLRTDLLEGLLRLRRELGATFKIAATTWHSRELEIAYNLAATAKIVDPLPRSVIAKIVVQVDRAVNRNFVGEVLDQSQGKPGLAVRLARSAIKAQDAAPVTQGAMLLEHLRRTCRMNSRDVNIVATLALGGKQGVTLPNAAEALDIPEIDVNNAILKVSGTGFLSEGPFRNPPTPVVLVPRALRDALVATTFFSGAASLDVDRALNVVDDATSATETLISVLARETTRLRQMELHDVIRNRLPADPRDRAHRDLWQQYAAAGKKEAVLWILDRHENLVELVADAALAIVPVRTLPLLLARLPDEGVHRALADWLVEPARDVVKRRRQALEAIQRESDGLDDTDALALVGTVFALDFRSPFRLDPVGRNEIDWRIGLLPLAQVEELFELWPSVCRLLMAAGPAGIDVARGIAAGWCRYGSKLGVSRSDEWRSAVRKYAQKMVADIVEMGNRRPGIVSWAKRTAEATGLDVELPPMESGIAAVLPHCPDLVRNDDAAAKQAEAWASGDVGTGVRGLLSLAEEAELAGRDPGHDRLLTFVETVADTVENPVAWTRRLASKGAPPQWVAPFLRETAVRGMGSQEMWGVLLENDEYRDAAVWAAMQQQDLPDQVMEYILEHLAERSVLPAIPWKIVREEFKLRLLRSEDRGVAKHAAGAMWRSDELTTLSRPVQSAWLNVMAESEDESLLIDVFLSRSPMARRVAKAWFLVPRPDPRPDNLLHFFDEPRGDSQTFNLAASLLRDRESRCALIRAMPADTTSRAFLALVDQDVEVYQVLLERSDLWAMHLLPFRNGDATKIGSEFAVRALRAGYSAKQIADSVEPEKEVFSWSSDKPPGDLVWPDGALPDAVRPLCEAMAKWRGHANAHVRHIAELVLERCGCSGD